MKIAVISDLHIGHCPTIHQLGHSDHDFSSFLYNLEKVYDTIILLGDIFEIEMENKLSDTETFEKTNNEHKIITKRFSNYKYIYIFGNHDLIGEKYNAKEYFKLSYNNLNYLFIHGHQFDHFYQNSKKSLSYWGRLCLKTSKLIYKWVSEESSFGSFSIRKENEKFQNNAIYYAVKNNINVIITGHTHEPKIINDKAIYINSGTCTYGRINYVHMDLDKQEYKIITEKPG